MSDFEFMHEAFNPYKPNGPIVEDDGGLGLAADSLEHRPALPRPGWEKQAPRRYFRAVQTSEMANRQAGISGWRRTRGEFRPVSASFPPPKCYAAAGA